MKKGREREEEEARRDDSEGEGRRGKFDFLLSQEDGGTAGKHYVPRQGEKRMEGKWRRTRRTRLKTRMRRKGLKSRKRAGRDDECQKREESMRKRETRKE